MELYDAIFCDDIRFELSNKLSLMGIYNDQIIFRGINMKDAKSPIPTKLAILLRFKLDETDQRPNKFEFEYSLNDKSIIKLNGEFKSEENQLYANLALTAENIPLELGYLGYSVRLFKGTNLLLEEKDMNALKVTME